MTAAARYTSPASVKAAGPGSQPVEPLAHSAIPFELGAFFAPAALSLADCVGQPRGWPAPVPGTVNPARSAAPFHSWCDGSCPQALEPVMNPAPSISPVIPNALINKSIASTIGNVRQVLFLLYALDVRDTGKKTISPDQAEVYRLIDESLDHVERKLRRERRPKSITQNQSAA